VPPRRLVRPGRIHFGGASLVPAGRPARGRSTHGKSFRSSYIPDRTILVRVLPLVKSRDRVDGPTLFRPSVSSPVHLEMRIFGGSRTESLPQDGQGTGSESSLVREVRTLEIYGVRTAAFESEPGATRAAAYHRMEVSEPCRFDRRVKKG
jgi:hypothetical protein